MKVIAKYCNICKGKISFFQIAYNFEQNNSLCKKCFEKEKNNVEEKKRIYREEQNKIESERKKKNLEKIEREKKEQKELYKLEFSNQYSNLYYLYISLNTKVSILDNYIDKASVDNDFDLFEFLTYEMYKKIGDTETMNKVSEILFNGYFSRYIGESILESHVKNKNNVIVNLHDMFVKNINLWNSLEKDTCNRILDEMICGKNYTNRNELDKFVLDSFDKSGDILAPSINSRLALQVAVIYADVFIRAVILSRNVNKFINNLELYKMYTNLKTNTHCSTDEICDKLFPIYIQFYINDFQCQFDKNTFNSLLKMVDSYNIDIFPKESIYNTLYDKDINELIENKINFKYFLQKIDNKLFFKTFKYKDCTSENNNGAYTVLYHYIIKKTAEFIPVETFFEIVIDKYGFIDLLKSKERKIELEIEKRRLLEGNLLKENIEEVDKFSFDNINTGYEFENYLKNIFDKLGYISIVTKSSGDQGGDLIIEKDKIKTVVQAKFYSSPVGNKAIQEVVSAIAFYKANKGMVVTNNIFTKAAVCLAEANNIELLDGEKLNNIRNRIIQKIS